MAAAQTFEGLKREATCSVCLDFFRDPVITECGHNFCPPCLTHCWKAGAAQGPCPQCKKICKTKNLRENRQLRNVAELVRAFPEGPEGASEGSVCEKHQERVKIYCRKEEKAICTVCSLSAEHRGHHMAPLEEAALEHKVSLQTRLKQLSEKLKVLCSWIHAMTATSSKVEGNFKSEEERITEVYDSLKRLFEERKQNLLNLMMAEKMKNLRKIQDKMSALEVQKSSIMSLIGEIEQKCKQEDLELMTDSKSIFHRSDNVKIEKPVDDSAELEQSTQRFHVLYVAPLKRNFKELVTLDPDTAHPSLHLSESGRLLERTDKEAVQRHNPKRFTVSPCVLGKKGFTSGIHYWEVQLLQDDGWAVGVALESVGRNEQVTQSPERGIWAIKGERNEITALTSPTSRLSPHQHPRKLGLYLHYEKGQLSMFNIDTWENVYSFNGAAFQGRVFPYFWVGEREDIGLGKRQKTMTGFDSKEGALSLL